MIAKPVKVNYVSSENLSEAIPAYPMPNTTPLKTLPNPPAVNTRVLCGDDIFIAVPTTQRYEQWNRHKSYFKGDRVLDSGIVWEAQQDLNLYPSVANGETAPLGQWLYAEYGSWSGDGTVITQAITGTENTRRYTYTKGNKFEDHYIRLTEELDDQGNVTRSYTVDVSISVFEDYPKGSGQVWVRYTVANGKLYLIEAFSFPAPGTGHTNDETGETENISGWYKVALAGTELLAERKRNELRAICGISSLPSVSTSNQITYRFVPTEPIDCIFVKTNARSITVSFGSRTLNSLHPYSRARHPNEIVTVSFYLPRGVTTTDECYIQATKRDLNDTVTLSLEAGRVILEGYGTKESLSFGFVDYSVSQKNMFGILERVERARSITISTEAEVEVSMLSYFATVLASLGGSTVLFDVKKDRGDELTHQNFAGCGIGYITNSKIREEQYMGAVADYATLTLDFEERV